MQENNSPGRRGIPTSSRIGRILTVALLLSGLALAGLVAAGDASAALQVKQGTFTKRTSAGATTVTGVGFQPKALIFYWTQQTTSNGTSTANLFSGQGFAADNGTAITMAANVVGSLDGVTSTDTNTYHANNLAIVTLPTTANPTATEGEATVTAMSADGFTVSWTKATGTADIIHYVAIGGADLIAANVGTSNISNTAGSKPVTGVGFQPDAVLLLANNRSTAINTAPGANGSPSLNFGFIVGGATPTQGSIGWGARDAQTAVSHGSVFSASRLNFIRRNAIDAAATVTSMDPDGFTLNVSVTGGAFNLSWLALKGGSYKLGTITQPTTGTAPFTTAYTGVGFQPRGILLASGNSTSADDVVNTTAANGGATFSLGAASAATARGAIWAGMTGATVDANRVNDATKILHLIYNNTTTTRTTAAVADLSSFNVDGFTLNWTTRADTTARRILYFAMGDGATPTTTLADGTNPASVTVGPGDAATMLNAFTLQTTSGSDTVTAATVTLAPANAFANLASVELTNDAGTVVYGTVANPASNTVNFTGLSIPVTTTLTQFKVRVTPKAHAAMPAVPGASYATTGTVTAFTCTNVKSGTDTGSATVTVDNASPANPTGFAGAAGNNQVTLNWTNPGSDFGQVVVLRKTASISDVPIEGANYSAGNTVGTSTVVYVGSGSSHIDTTAVNGTGYFYKIFARDPYGNYSSGGTAAGPYTPAGPTLTVGNGTNPGSPAAPLAPGAALTSLNAFTLQTSTGTDTVTTVTVTLTPGSHEGIGAIAITNAAATVTYGTLNNPASSTPAITLSSNITASTTSTQYLVRIQPKSHAAMPVPPGALYTVSGTVTNVSSANTKIYQDTGSATIEIDNASPDVATWGAIVPDNTTIELNWVNPSDPDIDESAPVVVLRKAGSTFTGAEKPSEGVAYAVGNTIGAATVASLGTDAFGVVEGFIDTGLTNFTDYYYAIYVKDVRGNYSLGEVTGPHQPWMPVCVPAAPTLSVTPATRNAIPTDVARYTVSLTNNDNYLCAPTTFTVDASDANLTDFDPSLLNVLNGPQVDPLDVTLSYGQTRQITLTVFVKGTATLGNSNVTTVSASAPGHAAPAPVQVTTLAANPLMHNSRNTGSTKWATSGGWGITGGKYGTFNCFICHAESSHVEAEVGPNVKKIRQTIQMPADAPAGDNWPNGTKTISGVEFLDTRAGTADYSYAVTPSKHNASTKVCQVCHTFDDSRTNGVQYHAYDMSAATDGQASHSNGGDCLGCHPHQGGFKAQGCTGCHGYPLNDLGDLASSPATGSTTIGAHVKHEAAGYSCDYCHGAGSSSAGGALHATGAIAIDFFGFGQDEGSDGTYFGHTQVTTGYAGSDAGAANDSRSCNAVYCHGGTIGGSSPAWTGGALACGSCHNATSGAAGWLGSHAVHLNAVGMNCSGCHGAGYAKHDSGTGAAPAGHLNGAVVINLGSYGSYSKASPVATQGLPAASAYGTCSVTCHGSGTPTWGASLGGYPAKCVSCHNDGTAGTALINAVPAASKNAHLAHVNANTAYLTELQECNFCHGADAHLGTHSGHTNGSATFGGQLSAYSTVNRNCTNTCHQATTTDLWVATPPALACLDCHSGTFIGGNNAAKGWNATPASGLHAMTASGVQKHDNTLTDGNAGNGVGCRECHVTEPGTHIDGSFTANGAANGDRWVTRANMTYNQTAVANGRSGSCLGSGLTGCHTDGGAWARLWSTEANQADTVTAVGSSKCNVCHGQWASLAGSAGWAAGTTHAANATRGSGHEPAAPDCDRCHVYGSGTGRHDQNSGSPAQRRTEVNNNATGIQRVGSFAGCTACHGGAANTSYNFPVSVFPTNPIPGSVIPSPPCASCHNDAAKAAQGVPQVVIGGATPSSHTDPDGPGALTNTGASPTATCEHCHAGHADGTTGANDIEISTVYTGTTAVPTMTKADGTTALYAAHNYKIRLGGTQTVGKTVSGLSITFTAPNIIAGTGIGSGTYPSAFRVGDIIQVKGSTSNGTDATPKYFTVTAVAANQLTVAETITAEAASTTEVISSTATEAQFCWNCHTGIGGAGTYGITEWEANNNADTGSLAYHYGSLFTDLTSIPGTKTANWVSGNWRSGKGLNSTLTSNPYWYKRGKVRSTHSANFDGTTAASDTGKPWKGSLVNTTSAYSATYNKGENLDDVAAIRCTYCHDVHGTHNGIKGDNSTGQPYLRGTWLGNPYPEDGAPRWDMANNYTLQGNSGATIHFGRVPRASASPTNSGLSTATQVGGYWIDQNSNNPVAGHANTAFRTATGNAGLCEQCHGNGDGTWSAAEIGAIDQITGENLWVSGFNGHANSVVGGTMSETGDNLQWNNTTKVGRNIFNRTVRGSATAIVTDDRNNHANTDMGVATLTNNTNGRGYSYRSAYATTTGYSWFPRENVANETGAVTSGQEEVTTYRYFAWNNVDYNSATTRNGLHAAGTLRLQVTNVPAVATETPHNAQANYHTFSCSKCHNPHASRLPKLMITNCLDTNHNTWEDKNGFNGRALPGVWAGLRHSQWAAAQNCHRLDARATNNGTVTLGVGWNKATPWIEDTAPNPASGSGKTVDLTTLPAY